MAANIAPIFPRVAKINWGTMTATANTAKDGTGTVVTVFTADATNGSRLDRLRIKSLGNNPATVIRFFINNGSSNATPANNSFAFDVTIGPITNSEVAATTDYDVYPNIALPAGYKLNAAIGTVNASPDIFTGWQVTAFGGDY